MDIRDKAGELGFLEIDDNTLVVFNGELCYWGDLTHNERMEFELGSDVDYIANDAFWPFVEINDNLTEDIDDEHGS